MYDYLKINHFMSVFFIFYDKKEKSTPKQGLLTSQTIQKYFISFLEHLKFIHVFYID